MELILVCYALLDPSAFSTVTNQGKVIKKRITFGCYQFGIVFRLITIFTRKGSFAWKSLKICKVVFLTLDLLKRNHMATLFGTSLLSYFYDKLPGVTRRMALIRMW